MVSLYCTCWGCLVISRNSSQFTTGEYSASFWICMEVLSSAWIITALGTDGVLKYVQKLLFGLHYKVQRHILYSWFRVQYVYLLYSWLPVQYAFGLYSLFLVQFVEMYCTPGSQYRSQTYTVLLTSSTEDRYEQYSWLSVHYIDIYCTYNILVCSTVHRNVLYFWLPVRSIDLDCNPGF